MPNHRYSVVILTQLFAAALAIGRGADAAAPSPAGADSSPAVEKRVGVTLPDVLERVRVAAAAEDWKEEGWTDPVIEEWLGDVVAAVQAAGHGKELPAPVKFADYARREALVERRVDRFARPRPGEGALVVTDRLDVPHLRQTIALVDGDARIENADDCVIIAAGRSASVRARGTSSLQGCLSTWASTAATGTPRATCAARKRGGAALGRPPRPRPGGAQPRPRRACC